MLCIERKMALDTACAPLMRDIAAAGKKYDR
jgi:hypothetical protein